MKIKDCHLDFGETYKKNSIAIVQVAEVLEKNEDKIILKCKIVKSVNCYFDELGIYYYIDPKKEIKFQYYPTIITICSQDASTFKNFFCYENKILLDTTVLDIEFDNVEVWLDKENIEVEIFPPIYKNQ